MGKVARAMYIDFDHASLVSLNKIQIGVRGLAEGGGVGQEFGRLLSSLVGHIVADIIPKFHLAFDDPDFSQIVAIAAAGSREVPH